MTICIVCGDPCVETERLKYSIAGRVAHEVCVDAMMKPDPLLMDLPWKAIEAGEYRYCNETTLPKL